MGPFGAPFGAPKGPLIFPLCFGPSAQNREKPAKTGPQKGPKGPFWGPFGAFGRGPASGCFPCYCFWGPPGLAPPGPVWPLPRGPVLALFWLLSWPVLGPLLVLGFGWFRPVGWPFGLGFGALFWCLFGPFRAQIGPKAPPKALGFQPGLRLPVGFRVKSPFWVPKGPKVGQSGSYGAFRV